jgi:hypothetical protein
MKVKTNLQKDIENLFLETLSEFKRIRERTAFQKKPLRPVNRLINVRKQVCKNEWKPKCFSNS